MAGDFITIRSGERGFRAYFAVPETGSGPGLVIFHDTVDRDPELRDLGEIYAAEGYVVLCPEAFAVGSGAEDVAAVVEAVRGRNECTGKIGALGFGLGGKLACLAAAEAQVDCAVSYYGFGIDVGLSPGGRRLRAVPGIAPRIDCPLVIHFAEKDPQIPPDVVARIKADFAGRADISIYLYPRVSPGFDRKSSANYDRAAARLAHSRTIALLRGAMGPHYDFEALWEQHTRYEFETRDVAATMQTMVPEPYVNHIPVMTGGVGQQDLARFYTHHFIPKCPADFRLVPISRTVGADRLVDEMLVCFTHDVEIDWMLPGIAPTGRYVEVPTVAIVNFRGGKLYHEHIYWDQASVLVQIGLLDPKGLPVAGIASAKKLLDENRPSNTLMQRWAESAPSS